MTKTKESIQTKETTCPNEAAFRYTWPGRDESFICAEHASWLRKLAAAMGAYVQTIPIQADQGITCDQKKG